MEGLNINDLCEVLRLTPRGKIQNRMEIRSSGVGIANLGRKELQKPLGGRGGRGEEGRDARQGGFPRRAEPLERRAHAALWSLTPALVAAFCNASSSVASGNPARIASSR